MMPSRSARRRRLAAMGGAAVAAKKRKDAGNAQQQQEAGQDVSPQAEASAPAQSAEPGGLSAEAIQKLKEIGELHDQNVLTDEEFEREKAKLLGT